MKKFKTIYLSVSMFFVLCFIFAFSLTVKTLAAPSQAVMVEPLNAQIIPYYEVWLRWNGVSDAHHYLISVRDLETDTLVFTDYEEKFCWVAGNETHLPILLGELTKGHEYRWCIYSVDSAGNRTYTPARVFKIESGDDNGVDTHFWKTTYQNVYHLDYFISAKTSGYDSILQQGVNAWNGISDNVVLHRDYTTGVTRELGIYENNNLSGYYGRTYPYYNGTMINSNNVYNTNTVTYMEVAISRQNIIDDYGSNNGYSLAVIKHEIGHVLGLAHTDGSDENNLPNAPHGNAINYLYDGLGHNPLIMNTDGLNLTTGANCNIETTDRDHLRIKWGA